MDKIIVAIKHFSFLLFLCLISLQIQASEASYSMADNQNVPLDEKLVKLFNCRNGFFIEVGAYDGIDQSNTKRLEEFHGWTGILVEPSEKTFANLCKNRPSSLCYNCALGSFDKNNTYVYGDFDGHPMSSIDGNRLNRPNLQKVLMRSLQSILDEVGVKHVNFFSLDVEGYELEVLLGIDFNKTVFDYILIEIYNDIYDDIVSILESHGYLMLENYSNYNTVDNKNWDGTHNDFLFVREELFW